MLIVCASRIPPARWRAENSMPVRLCSKQSKDECSEGVDVPFAQISSYDCSCQHGCLASVRAMPPTHIEIDKHADHKYADAFVLPCGLTPEEFELCLARAAGNSPRADKSWDTWTKARTATWSYKAWDWSYKAWDSSWGWIEVRPWQHRPWDSTWTPCVWSDERPWAQRP